MCVYCILILLLEAALTLMSRCMIFFASTSTQLSSGHSSPLLEGILMIAIGWIHSELEVPAAL